MQRVIYKKHLLPLFIFLSLSIGFSCKKMDDDNVSNLRFLRSSGFLLHSIHADDRGNIYCMGLSENKDSNLILKYNSGLQLIERINLRMRLGFTGQLNYKPLSGGGWVVTRSYEELPSTYLAIYTTNPDFEILDQKVLATLGSLGKTKVRNIVIFPDNDIAIACDTTSDRLTSWNGGINIYRLGPDLELKHRVFHGLDNLPFFGRFEYADANIAPQDDGSLFFKFTTPKWDVSGVLESNGKLKFQENIPIDYALMYPNSLSKAGANYLVHSTVNAEYFQFYRLYDSKNGSLIGESSTPLHITSNSTTGINLLPEVLNNQSGHLLFSEPSNSLFFLKVDEKGSINRQFEVGLPPKAEVVSFRQYINSLGQIIIGVNYIQNGTMVFQIMKTDLNGNVLK
ncbi:MAG: hypothetical protein H6605_05780 [Flavobacteriales bacterium]|nr:hypothetical protein [Flavobacteriales bacterium]